jgi:septal ring-binding cell division protein DamX
LKAQAISMDLFIAITILMIIIAGMAIITHEMIVNEEQASMNRDMQLKGEAAINSLVYSPGDFEENNNG